MADQILNSLTSTGVDLDDMNNELIVAIVRGVAGDALANSLEAVLNNMNVKITATLSDVNGNEISSDTVEFVVKKILLQVFSRQVFILQIKILFLLMLL